MRKFVVVAGRVFVAVLAVGALIASDPSFAKGSRGGSSRGASHHSGGHFVHGSGVGSRARIGFFIGTPLYAYTYTPYPGYVPLNSAPLAIEYIEKEPAERSPSDYWFFCPDSKTYYPYVKECPSGWQAVEPVTPQG